MRTTSTQSTIWAEEVARLMATVAARATSMATAMVR